MPKYGKASDQRLSASKIFARQTLPGLPVEALSVINAFRHQRFLHSVVYSFTGRYTVA